MTDLRQGSAIASTLNTSHPDGCQPVPRPVNISPPSPWARALGYAGLIPFVGAAALGHASASFAPLALAALVAYGATIVSFLGGIHWGLAFMNDADRGARFTWGVIPSLLAWVAIVLPASAGLLLLAGTLLMALAVDRRVYPTLGLQAWLPMRLHLTAVAALSCLAGAALAWR